MMPKVSSGEYPHFSCRNRDICFAALNAHDVYAEFFPESGIGNAFADKRAVASDVDVCKVHVADEIVVFAASAQFAFIEIVDKD